MNARKRACLRLMVGGKTLHANGRTLVVRKPRRRPLLLRVSVATVANVCGFALALLALVLLGLAQ